MARDAFDGSAAYWSQAYQDADTGWDLGGPTPAFVTLLESGRFPSGVAGAAGRALVPGCGLGHDVLELARRGWTVDALDHAPEAIAHLGRLAREACLPVHAVMADVFAWLPQNPSSVDVVLEYTCLCAIPVERRREYLAGLAGVLRPGGHLVAILYPLEARPDGPPFTVVEEEVSRMLAGLGLRQVERHVPDNSPPRRAGKEALVVWQRQN